MLSEMTWKEAEEAFGSRHIAIIPVGSNEQHGRHLPLGTDWMLAQELAKRVGEKTNGIVLPVMPFGWAEYHMDFPGTLYVSKESLYNVMFDVCRCLNKWGIRKIVFINGHGGNISSLQSISVTLRRKYGILCAIAQWFYMLDKIDGHIVVEHGGIIESALVSGIFPRLVNLKEAYTPVPKPLTKNIRTISLGESKFNDASFQIFLRTRDMTEHGAMTETGNSVEIKDFSYVTESKGRELLERFSNLISDFVKEFEKVELPKPDSE